MVNMPMVEHLNQARSNVWIAGRMGEGMTLLLTHLLCGVKMIGNRVVCNYGFTLADERMTAQEILDAFEGDPSFLANSVVGFDSSNFLWNRAPDVEEHYRVLFLALLRSDIPVYVATQDLVLRELTLTDTGQDILNAIQVYCQPRYSHQDDALEVWLHDWYRNPVRTWPPQLDQADAHATLMSCLLYTSPSPRDS